MQEARTLDLVNFFKKQKAEKKRSLEGKYMALKSFFNIALKWNVIQSNPMNGVDRPVGGKRYKEIEFYDEEQLGHANIQETLNTYSHLTSRDKKSASDLFNHFL